MILIRVIVRNINEENYALYKNIGPINISLKYVFFVSRCVSYMFSGVILRFLTYMYPISYTKWLETPKRLKTQLNLSLVQLTIY